MVNESTASSIALVNLVTMAIQEYVITTKHYNADPFTVQTIFFLPN